MKTKLVTTFTLMLLMVFNQSLKAQNEKIQTAFIFQLTRLVEWCPSGKQGNFTIGVLSDDATLLAELNSLQGRKVVEQSIMVKKLNSASEVGNVNIVFISKSKIGELDAVISKIGSNCTLIVSDKAGAAKQGAAISFIDDGGKIQFEVNRAYADKYSLKMNDQLIKLAKNVF